MKKSDVDNLGKALVYLRSRRQMTGGEVSDRSQVTRAMLSGYEKGNNRPSIESLSKILQAMGASWSDFDEALAVVEGEEQPMARKVSLLGALMGSEASRDAAADALRAIHRFCAVALRELGYEPDVDGRE